MDGPVEVGWLEEGTYSRKMESDEFVAPLLNQEPKRGLSEGIVN
jgi:hypothetical protein